MYEELVALLRKKYDKAPMVMEAADAIEELNRVAEVNAKRAMKWAADAEKLEARRCSFSLEAARRRESVYKCSVCGNYLTVRSDTLNGGRSDMNYCPFCGRKVVHKWQEETPAGPYDLLYEEGGANTT